MVALFKERKITQNCWNDQQTLAPAEELIFTELTHAL